MKSEAESKADFSSIIRYAQCWEDADILVEGLKIQPGDTCLSIASAGDNALAMLLSDPERVIALDLNPSQLACLELRVAAYKELDHSGLLELIGSHHSKRRTELYNACRLLLSQQVRDFWDARQEDVSLGIGSLGKFENYFRLFRRRIIPLIHNHKTVADLFIKRSRDERIHFYENRWNNWRWKLLFKVFFSRFVMGQMGRDPSFFKYVEGSVANRILSRARHALTEIDPTENSYLQWIMFEEHPQALPCALRPENFETIRDRIDRLEWHCRSIEDFLPEFGPKSIDRFNLSDIFEYMSIDNYESLLKLLVNSARSGGRLLYWNMLAPRSRPEHMSDHLRPLAESAHNLHWHDKAFFYNALVIEEVLG